MRAGTLVPMASNAPAGVDSGTRLREATTYDLLHFLAQSSHPDEPLPGTGSRHAVWWALQAMDPREGRLLTPLDFHYEETHPEGYTVFRWRAWSNQALRDVVDKGLVTIGELEPCGDWFDTLYPPSDDAESKLEQIRWFHQQAVEKNEPHAAHGCGVPDHWCRLAYQPRARRLQITDAGYQRVADRVPLSDGYRPYELIHLER